MDVAQASVFYKLVQNNVQLDLNRLDYDCGIGLPDQPFEVSTSLSQPRQSSSRKSPAKNPAPPRGFKIGSAIPVVRMLDEDKAKAFYLDYLGFQVDWEGRQSLTSPLYMQIRLGDALLHLDGHAGEDSPISQVIIQVVGLQQYCDYLIAKKADYPEPWPVDPRYQGRNTDMNLEDPFGNGLIFCSQTTEG